MKRSTAIAILGTMHLAIALAALTGCSDAERQPPTADPANGRLLLRQFGCGECHRIPGVPAASGTVGPPLDAFARRVYLAGFLPNTPENTARWIQSPRTLDPRTAMPDLQVTAAHARDMAAYLHTLR